MSLYLKHTKNIIESFQEFTNETKTITRFRNVENNISSGLNGFVSYQFSKKWTSRFNYNLFNYISKTELNGDVISNSGFMFNGFLNSSFQFSKKIKSEFAAGYNSPRITIQGRVPGWYYYNLGIRVDIDTRKSISLVAGNFISKYQKYIQEISAVHFITRNELGIPYRTINVNLTWRFRRLNINNPRSRQSKLKNDDLKGAETLEQ